MFVYRICNTNDDVSRQLLRIRHLQCFVDLHSDFTFGFTRSEKTGLLTVAGSLVGLGYPIEA
jgi:hypothetical protein